ncbi:MAG TPA: cation:proton antiporter [Longimicrobium sp.]|jgi:Kef-type K+ transport system membrane component KefB/mannitol/fructose-specific phosphotransferase system IIA component (Ntr-type)|uniref:cation:proton antiporter domain-containing protein n=1 Tax=Longimicrobium sp. TaxID=2029185 RepID=UPI002EDADEC1
MPAPLLSIIPTPPFTDPVLIVALATLLFLAVPILAERVRVPGVIGLIVAGAAVGPHGAGLLARDQTIVLLGTVGLLYLMLMVGLELDLHQFNRYRNRSIVFGLLSFGLPAALGLSVGLALGYSTGSALLLASAFSSHTLLAYPIASRLGIVRNEAVTTALGGTILTEILALLLLAVVANSAGGGAPTLGFWARLAVSFGVYVGVVMWGLPRLGRWFFRQAGEGGAEFIFVLAALFTVSYLSHAAGVEPIVGALLAGLALNRLVPSHGPLMNRIHFVGNTIFIPFFLLSVGMLVNVRALDSARAWTISIVLTVGVIAGKWLAARVTEKAFGYDADEGWVVFGLTVPHAAGTLAIVLVGYELELLDQTEVNGVVLMILATCLAGPWAVERFGRRLAAREEQKPYNPDSAPRRILIPLANPATAEALMDLAFVVRGRDGDEPLYPLTVAPQEGGATEAWVAEAERMLGHAVHHAAAAEVPTAPLTRVDANVAAGIVRGIAETRSTEVIIGWDGRRTGARAIFGTVLDQLLERTRQMVLVAKLGHPLSVTRRLVVLCPPGIDRHPGFQAALSAVNRIAAGIGAGMAGVVIGRDAERLKAVHAGVRPQAAAEWQSVADWGALDAWLRASLRREDLVVLMGARRGTVAWHPRLARLPGELADLAPESFLAVYAPESEAPADRAVEAISGTLVPERVVRVQSADFGDAMREMLGSVFDADTARAVAETLEASEQAYSTEIVPGVALPHARLPGLPRSVLVLGVSREGVPLPHGRRPARLLFVLVSSAERAEEHLRALAQIAQLLADPAETGRLLERYAPEARLDWLHVNE